jgi:predicted Zn-dependent protease
MPEQALLVAAALSGGDAREEWWQMLQGKLRAGPVDQQSAGSLQNLVQCQIVKECKFPVERLIATLAIAANQTPANADVLGAYSDLALQYLGDRPLAEELSHDAMALEPTSLFRIFNYARTLALVDKFDAALRELNKLEKLDRIGRMRSHSTALRALIRERQARPAAAT